MRSKRSDIAEDVLQRSTELRLETFSVRLVKPTHMSLGTLFPHDLP